VCSSDLSNGTPDLRGRFILTVSDTTTAGATIGGQENVTLTIDQMPEHNHGYDIPVSGGNVGDERPRHDVYTTSTWKNTGPAGEGKAFNNMPPYYVLVYIIKL
jgi:microcystin-dependent protein